MRINDRYLTIFELLKKYNFIYGGSSSGKSYAIAQYCVLRMLEGEAVLVMRNTQTSFKKTILNDFKEILMDTGLGEHFTVSKSFPLRITSKIGTGECLFIGADKGAEDNKGIKPSNGAGKFTIFFADECDQIPKNAIMQMRIRIRGISSTGASVRYIYSFNPTFRNHYLFDDFICPTGFDPYKDWDLTTEDTLVARMTYKDNISFLEQDEIDELVNLGKQSKYYEQVYLKAEPGVLGKRCIEGFEVIKGDEVPTKGRWLGGIDHGFNDPIACVWGLYDDQDNVLYITNELYGSELSLNYVADNIPHDIPFTGDSEDPRSNATLKTKGVSVKGAKKGPGSVFGGIMYLNTITIKVVDSCIHTIEALSNYSWKVDKMSDQPTDQPSHDFSHGVDSIRYMMEKYSRGKSQFKSGHSRNV